MKYLNSFNESLSQNWYYEFHLSTEPDLKIGENFKKQIRTNSSFGERGDSMEKIIIFTQQMTQKIGTLNFKWN